MRWFGAVVLVAAIVVLPARAMAADCADLRVPGQFDVFARDSLTSANVTYQGRVAVGGNASLAGPNIGTSPPLTVNPSRADLVVGGNLTVQNGGTVGYGKVTYGGTLTGSITVPNGGTHHESPPFDFGDEFTTLAARSTQWADLAGTPLTGTGYGVTLTGTDPALNVFSVTASQLERINGIVFDVPSTSTVLVNVAMDKSDGSFSGVFNAIDLKGLPPQNILWNFPLAQNVQTMTWVGTVLAPSAKVTIRNGTFRGAAWAGDVNINGIFLEHHPFGGCLPTGSSSDLALASLCTDPYTNLATMRVRNSGTKTWDATWSDGEGQSGKLTVEGGHDYYFNVLEGDRVHHIVISYDSTTVKQDTSTRTCSGTITVHKVVTGLGPAPPGPWQIRLEGNNRFSTTVPLFAGDQKAVTVPGGGFQTGSFVSGPPRGGYDYYVSEPDPLGALVSVDRNPVTIQDGESEAVTVGNDYPEEPTPPGPEPPPVPQPPDPTIPPDAPQPAPTPDLVRAASLAEGADLVVTETITPRRLVVGDEISVLARVRNRGPLPAVAMVATEIPQLDPRHPNQVAKIISAKPTVRATPQCTTSRPLHCRPMTLAVGAELVVRARALVLVAGALKSVIFAASQTPDPNTSNNFAATGLVVRRPAAVRVAVRAPAVAGVGEPVSYRVIASGSGSYGARFVRFCHRPAAGLLVTSAPGTFRSRGRLCRDVRQLRQGQQAGFTVRAIPASSAAGRRLRLRATATAPDARTAFGSDRIAIVAQSFAGSGRG